MNSVRVDFSERAQEVSAYVQFVEYFGNNARLFQSSSFDLPKLEKTMKANCYLLIYNLVESTVRNAIEAIFDELRNQQVRFDECRNEIQDVILGNLRRRKPAEIRPRLRDLSLHIISETFDKEELFSGNVDARKIRETARIYGFESPRGNGESLKGVKDRRNELAHGKKSFAEVGRDRTIDDIKNENGEVISYLGDMLERVEDYLSASNYRRP